MKALAAIALLALPAALIAQPPADTSTFARGMYLVDPTAGTYLGTSANPLYVSGGGGGGGSVPTGTAGSPNAAVVTVQGISGGTPQNVNNSQVAGVAIATGAGATNTGTQRFVLANDQTVPVSGTVTVSNTGFSNTDAISQATPGTSNNVTVSCIYSSSGSLGTATLGAYPLCQADIYGNIRARLIGSASAAPTDTGTLVTFPTTASSNTTGSTAPLGVFPFVWNGSAEIAQRGDTNGTYMVNKGGSSLATGQVSVTTTATLIAAARAGRQRITVTKQAANNCAYGNSNVTLTTGFIPDNSASPVAGVSFTLDSNAALYGICSAATTDTYVELF